VIRIRHTEDHDDEIAALDAVLFPDPALDTPLVIHASAECWGAFDGDTLIGYAVAYLVSDGSHYLDRYGVASEYAGCGIGRRLLRRWLAEARRAGASHAWTYTYSQNASSNNTLIAAGLRSWAPGVFPLTGEKPSDRHNMWRRTL